MLAMRSTVLWWSRNVGGQIPWKAGFFADIMADWQVAVKPYLGMVLELTT
jgi:hypothetical protein